jgi:hypothetical protein
MLLSATDNGGQSYGDCAIVWSATCSRPSRERCSRITRPGLWAGWGLYK